MTDQPPAPTGNYIYVATWVEAGSERTRGCMDLQEVQRLAHRTRQRGHEVRIWRLPVEHTWWQWRDTTATPKAWRRYSWSIAGAFRDTPPLPTPPPSASPHT